MIIKCKTEKVEKKRIMKEKNNMNNLKYKSMKYNERWNGVEFLGLHTVVHHQYFHMVDLLIQYC